MPTTTPFNNLITFSRGSNATVTGPNGLIQWAPNNLLTNSESFNVSAWVKNASTVTANVTASPDGAVNADKMVETAATDRHAVYQAFTYGAGLVYAATVYAKKAERNWIYVGADTAVAEAVFFDLDTGTVGNQGTGYVGSITNVGDGWYRCTVIITQSTALPPNFLVVGLATANGTVSYAGDGTSGVFVWGAQLELGSTATTYNPTTVKNLLGFSEAFDNAAWTKGNASIVTGAQANPINNLFNAQKLMENTANAEHSCRQSVSGLIANTPITVSVYLKAAERTIARVLNLDGANFYGIFVDLATGSFISTSTSGTFSNGSYSIVSVGSGWFRVSVTATIAGTARSLYINTGVSGPSASYTGDGNSGVYIYGAQLSDSASLDPYVPTPGAAPSSTAFYGPRFDFDPVTLLPRGLLVEEQRTNLLLNSLITGANLSTQNVTVTAVAHTISFYGTGSITLSGAHSATVNGTGAYPTRTTLTFTPTAGTLTCTVSGTVQFANLEVGAFATSYIPTVASTVTRSADVATITGQNFAQWYRQDEGTFVADAASTTVDTTTRSVATVLNSGTPANCMRVILTLQRQFNVSNSGATQADLDGGDPASGAANKIGGAYAVNNFALSLNGGTVVTDTTGTVPTVNTLTFGANEFDASRLNGHIRAIRFIPARAADFQLQGLST